MCENPSLNVPFKCQIKGTPNYNASSFPYLCHMMCAECVEDRQCPMCCVSVVSESICNSSGGALALQMEPQDAAVRRLWPVVP